ncbi:CheR family methyltransferase [Vallitalea okinawensis]|uniref:CheR family methyltransferase n=1 Tax=Vallitalea okinawensis TaxID=2078660 RepID=UPI000CFB669D|nr:protein-glutamate O-methyltransferase CheR [Vallitalea okinawensis]
MKKVEEAIMTTEEIEVKLFIEGMYLKHGYDFRDYSWSHMKRRIKNKLLMSNLNSISEMQHKMLTDDAYFKSLLPEFSINVTEMYRDPEFFDYVRKEIIPLLKTYPKIKIWHAGCSTGEEVYSMAIMLQEEGVYDRCQIYATDFNEKILEKAKEGIYPLEVVKDYTSNYIQAGGKVNFADYYTAKYDAIIMHQSLKKNIIFACHNVVTDQVFGEMNMIICRNVMIYFNNELQNRVIKLFNESLCKGGILCLGSKETLKTNEAQGYFEVYEAKQKVYRKRLINREYNNLHRSTYFK